MKSFLFIPVVVILFVIIGCEKAVDFKLDEPEPKIVVEATIENNAAPFVILSRSLNYFSEIDPQLLASSFVRNAKVSISNGTKTHKLKEYSLSTDSGYVIYYYSIDSSNLSTAFVGQFNTPYTLRIIVDGREYTAATTIPNLTKKIDSLWWKQGPPIVDSNKVVAMVRATDPKGFGDYIRYYTKKNREPFYPPLNSVFDDFVIDGTTYDVELEPGVNRNSERNESEHFFHKGDTVVFKTSNIDKTTFDFWRTMEYSYASVGNPFATPVKVLGNIKGGALGYFGGYASQYHTLVIPK